MPSAKKRYHKDTAKELLQDYFEGLIKQNKKLKVRARLYSKEGDTASALSKNGL